METAFPTIAVYLFVVVILLAYYDKVKLVFAAHAADAGKLRDEQQERFAAFENAASLQLATNHWNNKAVKAKSRYETVGLLACCAAPALICLSGAAPGLKAAGLASERGIVIAQGIVYAMVFLIVYWFRHPTRPHVENRLRSELLRSHLHCLLARVGPYTEDESVASQLVVDVPRLDAEDITTRIRELEWQCIRQSAGIDLLSTSPEFGLENADAYLTERVEKQAGLGTLRQGYFSVATERMQRAYKYSARGVFAVILVGTVVGGMRVFAANYIDRQLAYFLYACCGAFAVLIVSLRSVFGWDSKASLYLRQAEELHELAESLQTARSSLAEGDQQAAMTFRRLAARFEALMAHEACDWKMITDREYYDVTP